MGFDPLTVGLGITAASSIYNAVSGSKNAKKQQGMADQNYQRQQQAYDQANNANTQKNNMLQGLIQPLLTNGSSFNTGQDGMMQQMRGLPTGSGGGGYLDAIRKLSAQDLGDQLSQQRGSVGSLGQRFGTAQSGIEARLRERAVTGLNAQYGQFANQQQQNNLGLLSILAGQQPYVNMNTPQQQYVPQQDAFGGALGDIGNLFLLYPSLKGLQGGGGSPNMTNSGFAPRQPLGTPGGIPGSLFGGVRF